MWDIARAWEYVTHNPFPRGINGKILLRLPALTKPKAYNYTLEETLAIIDQAPGKYKLLFRTAAEAGIRPGELCGMRRSDLVGRTIYLSQSVYRQKIQTPKHYLHANDKDDLAASDMLGALLNTTMKGEAVQ
jgi:integrase